MTSALWHFFYIVQKCMVCTTELVFVRYVLNCCRAESKRKRNVVPREHQDCCRMTYSSSAQVATSSRELNVLWESRLIDKERKPHHQKLSN